MTREEVFAYAKERYNTTPDYPWDDDTSAVLRHASNRKWYTLVMTISRKKLDSTLDGECDVINVKTDPLFSGSMLMEKGIYPAYHMNKARWLSIMLDTADDDVIKSAIDISYIESRK